MNQKITAFLILIIFSLFLFNSANAVIVYLRPPKMIIRLNTSDIVERSLVVENRNNISMSIDSTVDGNISEMITITNPSFEIQPNETKTIDFTTDVKTPGVYYGQIIVTYTTDIFDPVTIPSEITVVATGNPSPNIDTTIIPILMIILILAIIVSIIWFKRGRN